MLNWRVESAVAPAAHSGSTPVTVDARYVALDSFAAMYSSWVPRFASPFLSV